MIKAVPAFWNGFFIDITVHMDIWYRKKGAVMTLKETLRAIQRAFLKDVSPSKMPRHSDKPAFYTKEQELAMDWEARMQARAIHRMEPHTSVVHQHEKILHDMHEKFYANPDKGLSKIMHAYHTCMSIKNDKEQIKFEDKYVTQKVANYIRTQAQISGQGR